MTLYSYKGARPTPLPDRIVLSNGFTKTDTRTFSSSDIINAGWTKVSDRPEAVYPNKVEWDSTKLEWVIRPPNSSEINSKREKIRKECLRRLSDTDYLVIKAIETGKPIDTIYANYRQELRDLYNTIETIDPWTVTYPEINYK